MLGIGWDIGEPAVETLGCSGIPDTSSAVNQDNMATCVCRLWFCPP
jgi:hypothetical protein